MKEEKDFNFFKQQAVYKLVIELNFENGKIFNNFLL